MKYTFYNKYNIAIVEIMSNDIKNAIQKAKQLKYFNKAFYIKYKTFVKITVYYNPLTKKRIYLEYDNVAENSDILYFVGFKQSNILKESILML